MLKMCVVHKSHSKQSLTTIFMSVSLKQYVNKYCMLVDINYT